MPNVPEIDDVTKNRLEKTDHFFRLSIIGALLMLILMFAAILVQNQINANLSTENAIRNHKRTQDYVKCVAQALTVQIPQRNLDQCTTDVDKETKAVK